MPGYTNHLDHLAATFPGCKILFLLRDPLEVAESFERRAQDPDDRWPEANDAWRSTHYWNRALLDVSAHVERHPEANLHLVDYGDFFTRGSRDSFSALNQFLGLDLAPQYVAAYESTLKRAGELQNDRTPSLSAVDHVELLAGFPPRSCRSASQKTRWR